MNTFFKNNILKIAIFLIGFGVSTISFGVTCDGSTNPVAISSSCTDLLVDQSKSAVNITSNSTVSMTPVTGSYSFLASPSSGSITIDSVAIASGSTVSIADNSRSAFRIGGNTTITDMTNNGTISNSLNGGAVDTGSRFSYIGTLTNNGVISGGGKGITIAGPVTNIVNTGSIRGTSSGAIYLTTSTADLRNLTNSGSIYSANSNAIVVSGGGIGTITNNSTIGTSSSGIFSGTGVDIYNQGQIEVINNAQQKLVITGNLPINYNIIINGPTSYGGLTGSTLSSGTQTSFGIATGSTVTAKSYAGVLAGMSAANLRNTTGTYQGLTWALAANGSQYDLNFTGTNTAVTTVNSITAQGLQTAFALQNTVLVNGFTYDCPLFDKNNVCVSAGGRYTAVDAQSVNSGAAVLIGAYRWNNQVRLGAYIDQNVSTNTTGIIKVSNASPMVGLFGVWSERLDGTGAEVKVSAGYGQKNTTMTRPVIDGTEPGSGSSSLTSQGAQAIGKYGFAVADKTILSPYAGLRYTQNNMNGYTENASASVTAPLTYAPLNTNATTVVAGLGATYKVIPAVTLLASAGVEADTNTQYSSYSATGLYGLTPINMNPNPKYTRPTGMLGAYYDVEKNQRISLTGVYRQAPYQGVGATTYMALYTIGL